MTEPVMVPDLPATCWPVDWGCYPDADDLDPVIRDRSEALAVQTLRVLSLGAVGNCPITVRPCAERCIPSGWTVAPVTSGGGWMQPVMLPTGAWINVLCGCRRSPCSCYSVSEVVLPGPVGEVTEVLIDGATLDPTAYRVDNGNRLVRTDGGSWPFTQDMSKDSGEGTFMVTYRRGAKPDGLAAYVAGVLAAEFAKACTGGTCRLPKGVTSVVRAGVSMEIATGNFPNGTTGIREVDAWLIAYNPYGVRVPAAVFSPDVQPVRRTGGYA